MRHQYAPLLIAPLALAVLPFALDVVGLPLRTSIDVVVFAIACMGLNVLVGYTGLVSFGHGAWFGLGAYAAALSQRYWFSGEIVPPFLFAICFVAVAALVSGALRRSKHAERKAKDAEGHELRRRDKHANAALEQVRRVPQPDGE